MMDKQQYKAYIAEQLGECRNRDDLTFEICNKTGMDWTQATEFIEEVEYEFSQRIANSRQYLLLVMGWLMMTVGMGLVALIIYLSYLDGWMSLLNFGGYFYILLTGICMVAGGVIGMIRSG